MSTALALEIERNCQRCRNTVDEFHRANYNLLHPASRFPYAVVGSFIIGAAAGVIATVTFHL